MKDSLKFLPLLVIYLAIIMLFNSNELIGDEPRYIRYAENILQGYYTDADNPMIRNGPGYPLYLAVFLGLNLPLLAAKISNAFLIFFGIVFFYKSLLFFIPQKHALVFSYLLAGYYPLYRSMDNLMTEPLCFFLICGLIYFSTKFLSSQKTAYKSLLFSGFMLGYLILTKVFFSNVLFAAFALALSYTVLFQSKKGMKALAVLAMGFVFTLPWLFHTYALTDRTMYWSSMGGEHIYWMSSRNEEEFGSWISEEKVLNGDAPQLHPSHVAFAETVKDKPWIEKNDLYMEKGKERIKENPRDYILNVFSNTSRIFFNFPTSHGVAGFSLPFYGFINMFIIVPFVFSLYPAWLNRKSIPFEIVSLTIFSLIYFGGLLFVSAIPRFFILAVPFLLLWMAFIYSNFVSISFNKAKQETAPYNLEKR